MSQNISKPVESWELSALCLGELDNNRAAEVRHALSLSPELQTEYNQLSDTIATLRGSMNELFAIPSIIDVSKDSNPIIEANTLAATQRDTVLAAAAKHTQPTSKHASNETGSNVTLPPSTSAWQSAWPMLAVVAASIAIVFGLSPVYLRKNQSTNKENKIALANAAEKSAPVQSDDMIKLNDKGTFTNASTEATIVDSVAHPQKGKPNTESAATSVAEKTEQFSLVESLADNEGRTNSTTDRLGSVAKSGATTKIEIMPSEPTNVRRGPASTIAKSNIESSTRSREFVETILQTEITTTTQPATGGSPISGTASTYESATQSESKDRERVASGVQVDEYRTRLDDRSSLQEAESPIQNKPLEKASPGFSAPAGPVPTSLSAASPNSGEELLRQQSLGFNPPSDPGSRNRPASPNEAWGAMGTRDTSDNWHEELRLERRLGRDPTASGDRFAPFVPNPWYSPTKDPLSTVSIDVDTASYAKVRQLLNESEQMPAPGAVRIEEFVNYFDYNYATPQDDQPFSAALAVGPCPWNAENRLVRIAIQAKKVDMKERESANVVLLIDVSGSMNQPNKLPLVKRTVQTFVRQMRANDRIAIVVYAGAAGLVLPSTSGREQSTILDAIERLNAGGSTNGGQGIQLAYSIARENFVPNGINRVVLCTDGDFNVGVTGDDALVGLVKENAKSKVFLTCLGFGVGNFNDSMMEKISNEGNGIYGFVDNDREARRWMCEKLDSSLVTIAKDVKLQVEFNPATVGSYRLIGYENRILKHEDFNNDRKDAGDVNAGHRVTAFYEIVPPGRSPTVPEVDPLRYTTGTNKPASSAIEESKAATNETQIGTQPPVASDELLTLKIRYKKPEGDVSTKVEFPLKGTTNGEEAGDADFEWASHVALFATMLRDPNAFTQSQWKHLVEKVDAMLAGTKDADREEFGSMVRKAYRLVDAMAPRWDPKTLE